MHRLNIFLSCSGHSGWTGSFFMIQLPAIPNLISLVTFNSNSYPDMIFCAPVHVVATIIYHDQSIAFRVLVGMLFNLLNVNDLSSRDTLAFDARDDL